MYEYECDAQGHRFEVIQKFSDPLIEVCPTCGGHVHKRISSPAFQFKGSGWYITDYARKDSGSGKSSGESGESGDASSKESNASSSADKDGAKKDGAKRDGAKRDGAKNDAAKKDGTQKTESTSTTETSSKPAAKE